MKCNLDCSYCGTGLYKGHDNSTSHPPLEECLQSIDFMYEYVDKVMQHKPSGLKYVILNVYGGEALHHPNIVQILQAARDKHKEYSNRWHLTVTTTTNAIISPRKLADIIPLIDEFTVSYHPENTEKQHEQFKQNLITIHNLGKRIKCIVLMHTDPKLFASNSVVLEWLKENNINSLPRQLDDRSLTSYNYRPQQIKWFNNLYQEKSSSGAPLIPEMPDSTDLNLSNVGRACCGGRSLCVDGNQRERQFYLLNNKFPNWFCSVDWFFLYVKQVTKEVFVNKDCKMNYQGTNGPIGILTDPQPMLDQVGQRPTIQCKNYNCLCGLCAPKAHTLEEYQSIMKKYWKKS